MSVENNIYQFEDQNEDEYLEKVDQTMNEESEI
jgi:hypothetical protein